MERQMNYIKIYNQLITKAQKREYLDEYYERHHIIPRSMNGNDEPPNLVNLTFKEHYIAHLLLAKIFGGTQWFSVECFFYHQRKKHFLMKEMKKWVRKRIHLEHFRFKLKK
jgi:hypothetical protein